MNERQIRNLFVLILLGQIILLSLQVPNPAKSGGLPENIGLAVLAPIARSVDSGAAGVVGLRDEFRKRAALVEENRRMVAESEHLRLELLRLQDVDDEARRLAAALDYERDRGATLRVADIVYVDYASWLRTLVVRASIGRTTVNQPVVSASGLIGRVIAVSGPYAKVQMITDRAASVGAMLERGRRQGIIRGDGQGGLVLDYVPLQAQVEVGDRVLSSGIDGVYPRGLPIGTVSRVEPGSGFLSIAVAPAVDFGLLDQAYLVDHVALPQNLKESPIAHP
ncbi:MAG: rod shape-determining protein MreC [Acidobacteriota bacterium]